jgi:hypothetical protein
MATGMARSVTGAPSGFLEMMNYFEERMANHIETWQARPLSFTMSSPKNSARRFAVLMDVDFCPW